MEYYFSKTVPHGFEETKATVTEALKKEGFGLVSEIDMQAKLKEKLGVDFKRYIILGACNPPIAYKVVQAEEMIGVMLPCNVVLIDRGNGNTEVAAVNPLASMMAVQNASIEPLAVEVTERLRRVVDSLN